MSEMVWRKGNPPTLLVDSIVIQPLWSFLKKTKKLKTELPYDPAISLLGIYLEKTKTLIWKDTCPSIFIAALFTIAKAWKQPKCPSIDDWINKMWYTHTHTHTHTIKYHSAIKRSKILPFVATWMDLENIMLSEINETEEDNIMWCNSYVKSKK